MAGDGTISDLCGPLAEHQLRRDEVSTALACSGLRDSQCATSTQAGCQLTLERAPTLDVERLVDGFVRDPHGCIIGEFKPKSLADLLRAPTLAPAAICTSTMTAAVPRHLRVRQSFATRVHYGSRKPLLNIGSQPVVERELRYLGPLRCTLGLPLRHRSSVMQFPSPRGCVAPQLARDC